MTPKNWSAKIRAAVQRVHKAYRKCPWMFMNETDVHCRLYSELLADFSFPRASKSGTDWKWVRGAWQLKNKKRNADLKTIPLHANLAVHRGKKHWQHPDICLVDPASISFETSKKDSRRVLSYEYIEPKDAIGIEIKFLMSTGTRKPREWVRQAVRKDIKKLLNYYRGWFVVVDQDHVFKSEKDWKDFFRDCIRRENGGRDRNKLNGYYISRGGRAVNYRHRNLSR